MKSGKKSLAERIVYTAIEESRKGTDAVDPLEVVNKALENVRPRLEVKAAASVAPPIRCRWKCRLPARFARDALDRQLRRHRHGMPMRRRSPTN